MTHTQERPDTANAGRAEKAEAGNLEHDFSTNRRVEVLQRLENIPAPLREFDYWVLFKLKPKKDGKLTRAGRPKYDKVPLQPRPPHRTASTANPNHVGTFEEARRGLMNGSGADGVGFVLSQASWMDAAADLVGIDADGVIDPETGEVYPDKRVVMEMIHTIGSYTEVSPSGEGFRVFCLCDRLPGEFNNHEMGVEVYRAGGSARFLTVTGTHLPNTPKELRRVDPEVLEAVLEPFQPRGTDTPDSGGTDLPKTPPPRPENAPPVEKLPISDEFKAFLNDCERVPTIYAGDRSRALFATTIAMLGAGIGPDVVHAALMESDAYRLAGEHRARDPEGYLWSTVRKAAATVRGPAGPDEFPNMEEEQPDPQGAAAEGTAGKGRPPRWESLQIDAEEMLEASLTPKVIVQEYLYADLAIRVAPGGVGKTTLTLWEAVHIALGLPLYGRTIANPGKVLIITAEDARGRLVARLREVMGAMGLGPAEEARVRAQVGIWDVSGQGAKLARDKDGGLVPSDLADLIIGAYRSDPPVMVEFDPLISFGVAESRVNDNEQALVAAARRIIRGLDCCVRYTHHTGQTNAREGTTDQYTGRGGTALPDGSRMVQVLTEWKVGGKDTPPPTIAPGGNGQVFQLHLPKLSYADRRAKRTIWIRREGFGFDWATEAAKTREEYAREDAAALLRFLHQELAADRHHTRTSLDVNKGRTPLNRRSVRAAVPFLLQHECIEERDLPPEKRQGGRRRYLHPVMDEIPPPNPAEAFGGDAPENAAEEGEC